MLSWNILHYALQICNCHCLLHFLHFHAHCALFCNKNAQCSTVVAMLRLGVKTSCPLYFVTTPWRHLHLGAHFACPSTSWALNAMLHSPSEAPSLASSSKQWSNNHMKPTTFRGESRWCLHVLWVSSSKRVDPRASWSCRGDPIIHRSLGSYMWGTCSKKKKNVGQTLHLMDVVKDILCLCWSFATFDVCKSIFNPSTANGPGILDFTAAMWTPCDSVPRSAPVEPTQALYLQP